MRRIVLTAVALFAFVECGRATSDDLVSSWYPLLQVGNTWVYADEARDAQPGNGIDNPTVGSWTTTETVTAVETIPEGTRVTIRARTTGLVKKNGWLDDPVKLNPPETELLVHEHCVYELTAATVARLEPDDIGTAYDQNHRMRPEFRNALVRGEESAAFCFPMTAGGEWGRAPSTSPHEEDVWTVKALNGDPFGVPGARTFHVYGTRGSGDTTDYWFQQGIGVVQFVEQHHGTYDEYRRQLISATINGVRHTYGLQPARTAPLYASECRAGWRRYVREDGSLIPNYAACVAYARDQNR